MAPRLGDEVEGVFLQALMMDAVRSCLEPWLENIGRWLFTFDDPAAHQPATWGSAAEVSWQACCMGSARDAGQRDRCVSQHDLSDTAVSGRGVRVLDLSWRSLPHDLPLSSLEPARGPRRRGVPPRWGAAPHPAGVPRYGGKSSIPESWELCFWRKRRTSLRNVSIENVKIIMRLSLPQLTLTMPSVTAPYVTASSLCATHRVHTLHLHFPPVPLAPCNVPCTSSCV